MIEIFARHRRCIKAFNPAKGTNPVPQTVVNLLVVLIPKAERSEQFEGEAKQFFCWFVYCLWKVVEADAGRMPIIERGNGVL